MLVLLRRWRRGRRGMLMLLRSCWPGEQQRESENQSGHRPRPRVNRARKNVRSGSLVYGRRMRRPIHGQRVLDAKRPVWRTRIEESAPIMPTHDRRDAEGPCEGNRRGWCCRHHKRGQPRVDDGRREIPRLMTERGRIRSNTGGLIRSLMLVARWLCGRGRTVVVAAHRARQLAGGANHRRSNQDHYERCGDHARDHLFVF